MAGKGLRDLVAEASAVIDQLPVYEARTLHRANEVVFVDVRDQHEWDQGHIPGAVHAPRGFLEFVADPAGPMHNPALASGQRLVIYCGSGGRSALAAKTLRDMGITNIANMVGGVQAWRQAGGEIGD